MQKDNLEDLYIEHDFPDMADEYGNMGDLNIEPAEINWNQNTPVFTQPTFELNSSHCEIETITVKIFKPEIRVSSIVKVSSASNLKSNLSNTKRLPTEARNILFRWLSNHRDYPYPIQQEVFDLSNQTGLTEKQVRVFLTNNRSRYLKRSPLNGNTNIRHTVIYYEDKS